jgi:hypothetical protein
MEKGMNNQAFIDGQNLRYSTAKADDPWVVDLRRFRIYLERKYDVAKAYYFIGYHISKYEEMYLKIQEAGYILVFREHLGDMNSQKRVMWTRILFLPSCEQSWNTSLSIK